MPVIPEFERPGQEDGKFEASLDCIVRPCLKNKKERKEGKERSVGKKIVDDNEDYYISGTLWHH
jgi:hypothetical protein